MADFSMVGVCFMFEHHPTQDVTDSLNLEYGGLIETEFLVVGDDMANAVFIDDLTPAIRTYVVDLIISLASQTSGSTVEDKKRMISPLFDRAPIKLLINGGSPQQQITKKTLKEAFLAAKASPDQTLYIKFSISHLYFNMDENQTFLNWDADRVRSDSAFPTTAPTPPASTSGPIPSTGPSSFDINALATAFAAAVTAAVPAPAAALTPAPAPTPGTAYSGPTSLFTFNRNAFPPEVQSRNRIQDKEDGTPVVRETGRTEGQTRTESERHWNAVVTPNEVRWTVPKIERYLDVEDVPPD